MPKRLSNNDCDDQIYAERARAWRVLLGLKIPVATSTNFQRVIDSAFVEARRLQQTQD